MAQSLSDIDEHALRAFIRAEVDGAGELLSLEKFAGGQSNPTYLVTTTSGKMVLRRRPFGLLLPSAHAIDREFKAIRALSASPVPVPKPLAYCGDSSILGSAFYLMSFEDGRIFRDPALPGLPLSDRQAIYRDLVRVLATLHEVDPHGVGLADFGRDGDFYERQLNLWVNQYRAAETQTIGDVENLITWLAANRPVAGGPATIVHGDYKLDNSVFGRTRTEIVAVLDWELCTLGHPMSDLGHLCMTLGLPDLGPLRGLGGLDRGALGIPTTEEILDIYCSTRGLSPPADWSFCLAFAHFRYAAITQGVYRRALEGNASNETAIGAGQAVGPIAALALAEIANGA